MTADIKGLNYSYLFCLREFAKQNPREAALRFGVEMHVIEAIADATVEQIQDLADPSFLQFKMRSPNNIKEVLKGNDEARAQAVVNMIGGQ